MDRYAQFLGGRNISHICVVLAALLCSLAPERTFGQPTLIDLVRQSNLIFEGTAGELGKSTKSVPLEKNTVVVKVDRVLEVLLPYGNVTGKEVTVRLKPGTRVRPAERVIFFTQVYSAGASLGVNEIGTMAVQDPNVIQSNIKGARQALADEALKKRLTSARIVVTAEVTEVAPTEEAKEHKSEHDPLWWHALLRVQSTEKASLPAGTVSVNFASSDDVMWERSPKLKQGQKAIFLLQPEPERKAEFRVPGLYVTDPLDVLPTAELERVRRLLKTTR